MPPMIVQWSNPFFYAKTNEKFNIAPMPPEIRLLNNIPPFSTIEANQMQDQGVKMLEVAKTQNARFAILPVHTEAEKRLFSFTINRYLANDLLKVNMPSSSPVWQDFAREWNLAADGKNIFFKISNYLEAYHKRWTRY